MAKTGSIQIHDVVRRVRRDGERVTVKGFVIKSINLYCKVRNPLDFTKEQKFVSVGLAVPSN